jgi:ABC-2 type transport system ATP-binding protein
VLAQRSVAGLRIEPPSLEELFLRHYGDDLAALRAAEDDDSTGAGTRASRRVAARES